MAGVGWGGAGSGRVTETIKQWLEWEVPQTIKQSISRQLCESQKSLQLFVYEHEIHSLQTHSPKNMSGLQSIHT